MKGFRRGIRNFFGTSRAQTNGFVALLFIIIVSIFSQPAYRWWLSTRQKDFSEEHAQLDSLKTVLEGQTQNTEKVENNVSAIRYFAFDPGSVTEHELRSLGFGEKLASQYLNYRNKGGKFRVKSDLLKLYGMDSVFYEKLVPFILLPDKIKFEKKQFVEYKKPTKEKPIQFNLNEGDTLQFKGIYGIGIVLAKRIIKYRDKLGGFVHHDQLQEVYGLDTAVVKRIVMESFLPIPVVVYQINLNTADERVFAAHPYFSKKIAAAIVAYRFQHGNFQSVDDLGKVNLIDKNNLRKIYPYVTVE